MDSPQLLQQLIRRELLAGQCPPDIFAKIYCELGAGPAQFSPESISKWLDIAGNGSDMDVDKIPLEFQIPIRKISREFQQACQGLEARRCPANKSSKCKLHLLSARYSLDVHSGVDQATAYLFDNFYGQKERLQFTGKIPKLSDDFQFASIDSEHFLLIKTDYSSDANTDHAFTVYLVKLDSFNLECRVLDSFSMDGCLYRVVVDAENPQKFGIILCHQNLYWMRRGQLVEQKLQFDDVLNLKFKAWFPSLRLQGNKLIGVAVQDRCGYKSFAFSEMTIGAQDNQFEKFCDIDTDDEIAHQDYWNNSYVWFQDTCYFMKPTENDQTQLYKLDLTLKKMLEVPNKQFDTVCAQHIDQNGLLTVCTLSAKSGQHAWYRMPLKNPNNLSHLAMAAIGEQLMFKNDKDAFIQQIPLNLRPFSMEF